MSQPEAINWDAELQTPSRKFKPFPGLFFYSAWGYGDYYSSDGLRYWGQTSEAHELAKRDGLKLEYIDSLENYKPTYLGD